MATYVIGDIHGCLQALKNLLEKIAYSNGDKLWFIGDLVGKGPQEWEVLAFIRELRNAQVVLGNHDLHFFAERLSSKPQKAMLPGQEEVLVHFCHQYLALWHEKTGALCVHAGIDASWDVTATLRYAREIERQLRDEKARRNLFDTMYSNTANIWRPDLTGVYRTQTIINILTRMRIVREKDGEINLAFHAGRSEIPRGYVPCYEKITAWPCQKIVFGHWAALQAQTGHAKARAVDGGLVYGGKLIAVCLENDKEYSVVKD